jgi:O-antigen/teichoic acid export membrane protein
MVAVREFVTKIIRPGDSLKWKTIQGSALILTGEMYNHGLRLVGNMIMTRLLYPEAFGLMLIVSLVHMFVGMLSDTGINSAFVLKSRGREQDYLNAAWTLQAARGVIVMIVILICSWPISTLYDEPILFGLIAFSSLNSLLSGFKSPREMLYERDLKRLQMVLLLAFVHTVAMLFTVTCLFIYPSIWFLAFHGVLVSGLRTVLSPFVYKGIPYKFEVKMDVISDIFHYGKWIFLSSGLTFLAVQGSKLVSSFWMSVEQLGVFSIAVTLAAVPEILSGALNFRMLLPLYAELNHDKAGDFSKRAKKAKLGLFALSAPVVLIFALFGSFIVSLLYDARYEEAGWMLQVIILGTIFTSNNDVLMTMVLSKANSFSYTLLMAFKVVITFTTMLLGGYFYGFSGVIYGIAIAPALLYPILGFYVRRYGIYTMKLDYQITAVILLSVFLSWFYFGWPAPLQQ